MIAFTGKTQAQSLSVQVVQVDSVLCYGQPNGSITAIASGGSGIYSYAWSTTPVQTTTTAYNLPVGTYTVTVTDGSTNTATASATVYQPNQLMASISTSSPVKCYGQSNGSATVNVIGGIPAYTYQWDDGESTQTATNLPAGVQSVTVTDNNGCTATAIDTITQPTRINIPLITDSIKCFGGSTANISVSGVSGGTSPYSYLWTGGDTGQYLINVPVGIYTLTVTDANGCTASASAIVLQPTPLTMNIAAGTDTMLTCGGPGTGTGSISLNIVGGTYPWSYHWSNGYSTQNIMNLTGGTYTITITDHNGCMIIHTFYITQPSPLVIHIDSLNARCVDTCDGQITTAVTGGTPFITGDYHYIWNTTPPKTTENINNLCPGFYSVTVTDSNGCQKTLSTSIGVSDSLKAYFTIYPDTTTLHHYYVENDATGNPPITYVWSWGDGTQDTAAYPNHTYSTAGNYVICLTVSNVPCSNTYCDSAYLQRTSNSLISLTVIPGTNGIKVNELSPNLIKVYPNPATDILQIQIGSNSEVRSEMSELSVYDMVGNLVLEKNTMSNITSLNVSSLPGGVYIVQLRTVNGIMVRKFIKE